MVDEYPVSASLARMVSLLNASARRPTVAKDVARALLSHYGIYSLCAVTHLLGITARALCDGMLMWCRPLPMSILS